MKFVAYYRVSTQKQGLSGLGLEAQQTAVNEYVKTSNGELISSYVEVESGKKSNRTQLAAAIAEAQKHGATLIVAKLDRLSRDVQFLFELKNSGVEITALDIPSFNTLTLGIYASIAQHERELISTRTKAALAAKKARGETKKTVNNLTVEARKKGNAALKANAANNLNTSLAKSAIEDKVAAGVPLYQIAKWLNERGFRTARGKAYQATQVQRLLKRN